MKIGLVSLGCPKNLVDSEVMLGLAEQAGHTITADAKEAEVLIVNTCAFIDSAKQESIEAILEMAQHKKAGACRRLIVTGCLGERYREQLRRELPEVDEVLGTNDVPAIVRAIGGSGAPAATPVRFHRSRPTYLYGAETPRRLTTPPHLAYVKIAEGCNYKCAFCIIPRLRGPYRSRPRPSVVQEARDLAARGVRELLLVSQDTTFYGVDRGQRDELAALLRELDAVDGLRRIRLLYLYPTTITGPTLRAVRECERVCRYVDLPLQHASNSVLSRMRRPGTRAGYERLIDRIRREIPGVTLRTSFIVGFPGETAEEFDELCRFVGEQRFDNVGVFTYSHEEGTAAGRGEDDVPAAVKQQRRRHLMALQQEVARQAGRGHIGREVEVMVDGPSAEHPLVLAGRTEGQAPEIDGVTYLTDADPEACRPGAIVRGAVEDARGYDLVVRPLSVLKPA
ncbi:MAG TPA: 30S ribosomal protein S12 methylthiotransferase RimO [Vicinamibacterales bacterium]|mgnify:CR=1 FL=1|nr:30S ribosomal protein S12 methylthiotransferase RimO [Vicinamibacterales bacterium]